MKKEFIVKNEKFLFDTDLMKLYNDTSESENILYKLVFNVSNTCNLNCKYCYANGGNYNRENNFMSKETADKIIDSLTYTDLKCVYFFGGEPLLNIKLIKYIVNKLNNKFKEIDYRIVTNGVFLNKDIINFFDKFNFKLYISLDGPKNIHDYLRGESYDKIINSLEYIQKKEIKSRVELLCTYTKYHEDNISFKDLEDHFENLNFRYSIRDVITNDENLKIKIKNYINNEKEHINKSINRIINNSNNIGISKFLSDAIEALVNGNPNEYYCRELENYSKVYDYNGELYNCIRMVGAFDCNNRIVKQCNKKTSEICRTCWAKNVCSLCTADIVLKNNDYPFYKDKCTNQELYEYAFEKILDKFNSEHLELLINNYYKYFRK